MTRDEKIAEAQALRARRLAYLKIAERLGVACATVYRWLNPDYTERERAACRAYKDRNRDAMREYNREYNYTRRGWGVGTPRATAGPTICSTDERRCTFEGCAAILSRYNDGDRCSVHLRSDARLVA